VCAGALRSYLGERSALPEESLVAMAPVSVRREDERGALGNQISAMLVRLATDVEDPLERLRLVQQGTTRTKSHHKGVGARMLADYTHFVPFSLSGLAARLYTRMQVARMHKPIFNVIITNVPGPQQPLYFGGARLAASYGAGPIFDGVGLIIVVFSYAGGITISTTACREAMPDPDVFCSRLDESLAQLEKAASAARRPARPRKKGVARSA
jgi:diacylglycerol O-acyltransferase